MSNKDQPIPPPPSGGSEGETFDGILRQLQTLVEKLEGPDLSLEESLLAFERGIELSRRGQTILDSAERKVEILLKDGQTEPFDLKKSEP
jgi:exodeoxyribonuclease VII small subunit